MENTMKLNEKQLVDNWKKLLSIIEDTFEGHRKDKLLALYNSNAERMILAPASGRDYYHGSFPGGYVIHILNVISFSLQLHQLYERNGYIPNYTYSELIFTAMNHDLGKIGDDDGEYFITHNERWRKERGEIYVHNGKIRHMDVADRGLWLLQNAGINITQTEMLAIKLHDGLYDECNKSYLINYTEDRQLRDDLPHIIHQADMMATILEKNKWKNGKKENK